MSGGEVRKVSPADIQMVQNLIEQCLPHYLTQKEVIDLLHSQEKIEPSFTELVWQKLEEQNQEFFKAYHLRLMLRDQILEFNKLLVRQFTLMHQMNSTGVGFQPMSNGSHMPAMHSKPPCYAPENTGMLLKAENMQHSVSANLQGGFNNCGPSIHSRMQHAVDMSAQSGRFDVPPNMMLAQNSNPGMLQGMNGIKTEASYLGNPRYVFGADDNVLAACSTIGDASVSSFPHQLNGNSLLDDNSVYGFLGQVPEGFSFSNLTHDFTTSIIESFSGSPVIPSDRDSYLDSHVSTVEHQGDKSLDTISDFTNNFGSDS